MHFFRIKNLFLDHLFPLAELKEVLTYPICAAADSEQFTLLSQTRMK